MLSHYLPQKTSLVIILLEVWGVAALVGERMGRLPMVQSSLQKVKDFFKNDRFWSWLISSILGQVALPVNGWSAPAHCQS